MTMTRDDLVAVALALFGEAHYLEALALVDEYGGAIHEREVNRVKLAILELGDGKIARLPYFVKSARIDFRDVLTGQKLGPMSDDEEASWQAAANQFLVLWNTK